MAEEVLSVAPGCSGTAKTVVSGLKEMVVSMGETMIQQGVASR
jgi:hypothetical protein